jgi:hypothetical protein
MVTVFVLPPALSSFLQSVLRRMVECLRQLVENEYRGSGRVPGRNHGLLAAR